ncbi:hypothetical protein Tco_0265615 [Tanacetum coccineum]
MFRDKKGAENLAADHHSKTGKSLHQDNSRTMEIMKHFLSKSLGSIALKDESTPWFADLLQTSHAFKICADQVVRRCVFWAKKL